MKKILLLAAAILGMWIVPAIGLNPALAADMKLKAAPQPAQASYTGFYIGLDAGAGFTDRQFDFVSLPGVATGDIWPAGMLLGLTTGYSLALGPAIVQLEADWNYSFNRSSGQCGFVFQCHVQDSFLFDQGIWIGMPWGAITGAVSNQHILPPPSQWPLPLNANLPSTGWAATIMPKIGGGVTERNVKVVQSDPMGVVGGASTSDQAWLFGWWAGAGLEMPIAAGWSVAAEYKYRGFNKSFIPAGSVALFGPFAQEFTHLNEQSAIIKVKLLF